MTSLKAAKFTCSIILAVSLGSALAGCVSDDAGDVGIGDTSEGVAATVNGEPIGEKAITEYIAEFREAGSLDDSEAWGKWVTSNGYTIDNVREEVIDYYVDELLYRQAAKEQGVSVEQSQIDEAVEQAKSQFENEEAWQEALSANSMTEEEYRADVVEPGLLQQALVDAVVPDSEISDDELLALAQSSASEFEGARRSSHILFSSDNAEEAQEVLDKINAGELDFDTAVERYSIDSSAENGGDVGWDALNTFVVEYANALSNLEVGEISGLVESEYGIHLIKCTDMFTVPAEGIVSVEQIPEEILSRMRTDITATDKSSEFLSWFEEYKAGAEVQINDMPAGLPYDIDLSPYLLGDSGELNEEGEAKADSGDPVPDSAENASDTEGEQGDEPLEPSES